MFTYLALGLLTNKFSDVALFFVEIVHHDKVIKKIRNKKMTLNLLF